MFLNLVAFRNKKKHHPPPCGGVRIYPLLAWLLDRLELGTDNSEARLRGLGTYILLQQAAFRPPSAGNAVQKTYPPTSPSDCVGTTRGKLLVVVIAHVQWTGGIGCDEFSVGGHLKTLRKWITVLVSSVSHCVTLAIPPFCFLSFAFSGASWLATVMDQPSKNAP